MTRVCGLPAEWASVPDDPPDREPVDPLLLGVDVDGLEVTTHHVR